jgi:hypothetical protein
MFEDLNSPAFFTRANETIFERDVIQVRTYYLI